MLLVLVVLALRQREDWLVSVHGTLVLLHRWSLMKLTVFHVLATQIHTDLLGLLDCVSLIKVIRIHLMLYLRGMDLRAGLWVHLWVDLRARHWTLLTDLKQALLTLQ